MLWERFPIKKWSNEWRWHSGSGRGATEMNQENKPKKQSTPVIKNFSVKLSWLLQARAIRFNYGPPSWIWPHRTLTRRNIHEVSLLSWPAIFESTKQSLDPVQYHGRPFRISPGRTSVRCNIHEKMADSWLKRILSWICITVLHCNLRENNILHVRALNHISLKTLFTSLTSRLLLLGTLCSKLGISPVPLLEPGASILVAFI